VNIASLSTFVSLFEVAAYFRQQSRSRFTDEIFSGGMGSAWRLRKRNRSGVFRTALNSCPRGVSSSNLIQSGTKHPGAIAFTQTPRGAHSTAKDSVSEATAALLAEYAATSNRDTKVDSEAIFTILPYFRPACGVQKSDKREACQSNWFRGYRSVLLVKVEGRGTFCSACRVNQNVYFAECLDRFIQEALQRRSIGDVRRDSERSPPESFNFSSSVFQPVQPGETSEPHPPLTPQAQEQLHVLYLRFRL